MATKKILRGLLNPNEVRIPLLFMMITTFALKDRPKWVNSPMITIWSRKFEIRQPKGALLHLHFNAELGPERLLLEARGTENMFVYSTVPLTTQDALSKTEMMFKVMPFDTGSSDIFSPSYGGGGDKWKRDTTVWMKWSEFRTCFENKFPGFPGREKVESSSCSEAAQPGLGPAENWILQKMVLSEAEAYDPSQTVNG